MLWSNLDTTYRAGKDAKRRLIANRCGVRVPLINVRCVCRTALLGALKIYLIVNYTFINFFTLRHIVENELLERVVRLIRVKQFAP